MKTARAIFGAAGTKLVILSVRQANNAAIAAEEMSDAAVDELKTEIRKEADCES